MHESWLIRRAFALMSAHRYHGPMDAEVSVGTRAGQITLTVVVAIAAYFVLAYGSAMSHAYGEFVQTWIGIALCAAITAVLVAAAALRPTLGAIAGAVILLLALVSAIAGSGSVPGANPSVIDLGPIFLLGGVSAVVWTAGATTLVIARLTRSRKTVRTDTQPR